MHRAFAQALLGPVIWQLLAAQLPAMAAPACRIEVIDKSNGWPVPLVELRTTHHLRLVTDNAGVIAVDQPELLNREIWFSVIGQGYGVPKDGFGHRGVRLTPAPGKTLRVEVERSIVAKRLGRLTGGGLFAERDKLASAATRAESGVFGCDSVQTATYGGKCFWLWGDTTMPFYPLGIFDSTAAVTELRPIESLTPPLEARYKYFVDERGVPRGVAPMPGSGPTWITGMVSLRNRQGQERLAASYVKIKPPLEPYETGLCMWDDMAEKFTQVKTLWTASNQAPKHPPMPEGHATAWRDGEGREWILFGNPFPTLRCPATLEAWQDAAQWEPMEPQRSVAAAGGGEPIHPSSGSMAWNGHRRRWVAIFLQHFGTPSAFGELWYAEADAPTGPWGPAVKVLSHDNYTFYNPRLHPSFTEAESPVLLFEGTYTATFADRPEPTPRYDYNQVLYRLDLDDPALAAAQQAPSR
jgi:hypothetical protein